MNKVLNADGVQSAAANLQDLDAAATGTAEAFEFEGWAILELMGHRRLGGYVRMNGPLIRIDVHDQERQIVTQWYGAHSLYCLTPTTEAIAKQLTRANRPAPVACYELELPPFPRS
jgi:hypothetical protein